MTDIVSQYLTIASGAGWIDKSSRDRLRFEGADALAFLQALLSNDVASLEIGQGAYAAYLTPQGRMIADLRVYRRPDGVVADVPAGLGPRLAEAFDRVIFTEDVRVAEISGSMAQIAVVGGDAAGAIARTLGADAAALRRLTCWSHVPARGGFVARTDDAIEESYDVFVPAEARDATIADLERTAIHAMAPDLAEALRIDAGRPMFGIDMTIDTIPLEAGLLERAISTTKGCYVGQEVVIRVLHRGGGRVARRLVRLVFDATVTERPPAGAPLVVDGRDIGHVTSAAFSPRHRRFVALGYVHRDFAEAGRGLHAALASGLVPATIAALAG